jgi:diguanylate cyclase (GGDEF)-like protein
MKDEAPSTSARAGMRAGPQDAFVEAALLAGGVGLWDWTLGDVRLALSPFLETLLGYPAAGFDGTKAAFLARLKPLDRARFERALVRCVEGGDHCEVEFRVGDVHGGPRWFVARGRVVHDAAGAPLRIVGTMQEIPASVVTERRMRRQQGALLALVTRENLADVPLADAIAHITEVAGTTLDVERASVWLFNDDRTKLVCRSLYRRSLGCHMAGTELDVAAFPAYMRALEDERALDVADAQHDPRTRELAQCYLAPLGITSLLEATIRMDDGALAGVVCHEHVGPLRQWVLDERSFAASIADMVTNALTDDRRRRLSAALAESEERYRTFVEISTEAILRAAIDPPVATDAPAPRQADEIAARAVVVEGNPALARMLGVESAEALRGRTIASLLPDGVARRVALDWVRSGYRLREYEFGIPVADESTMWVLGSNTGVIREGALIGLWSTWRDISARKSALARLEHQARHDPLTGLPNRKWIAEQLNARVAEARERGEALALLLLDLDHFKEINDGLGHHAGDRVLKLIGPRLAPLLTRHRAEMARLGGDEFAVIVRDAPREGALVALAASLVDALRAPFQVGALHLAIDASLGAALFPEHGTDASTLLRCADVAMYEAKRKRQSVAVYTREMDRYSPRRLALAHALGDAIRAGNVGMHYQPIVSLRERRLAGVEALARWMHADYGMVMPDEFVPIAEMGDQIRHLTLRALGEAARQWVAWRDAGLSTVISVNLSTRVLVDASFAAETHRILDEHEMPGASLRLEITESAMLIDPARAIATIHELNASGIRFSIDDFGVGFSSLAHLKQLPLDSLKIDRSFVTQMARSERDASIVRSTIHLAHDLGLEVVAEGVEAFDTLALITEMGCDLAQGFVIGAPAPGPALPAWAREHGWR